MYIHVNYTHNLYYLHAKYTYSVVWNKHSAAWECVVIIGWPWSWHPSCRALCRRRHLSSDDSPGGGWNVPGSSHSQRPHNHQTIYPCAWWMWRLSGIKLPMNKSLRIGSSHDASRTWSNRCSYGRRQTGRGQWAPGWLVRSDRLSSPLCKLRLRWAQSYMTDNFVIAFFGKLAGIRENLRLFQTVQHSHKGVASNDSPGDEWNDRDNSHSRMHRDLQTTCSSVSESRNPVWKACSPEKDQRTRGSPCVASTH